MLSFTERMEIGRDLAIERRNKGLPTGKPAAGHVVIRRHYDWDVDSWDWLAFETKREWQRDCRRLQNDFSAMALNPINDQPDMWEGL